MSAADAPEDEAEVEVPAGTFWMGRPAEDAFAAPEEQPLRRVELAAFRIDLHPVSNRRFAAFVDAGGYRTRRLWSAEGWRRVQEQGWSAPAGWARGWTAPELPVSGVSWHEAQAFCRLHGRRLPTSAEWEKAARGDDRRAFPWGDALPHRGLCNFAGRRGGPSPLGSYPAGRSPYGLWDMAGNVNNWVEDVHWAGFGAWCLAGDHLRDPCLTPGLAERLGVPAALRVDRGGGYLTAYSHDEVLGTTFPLGWPADSRELWHGFRTVRADGPA